MLKPNYLDDPFKLLPSNLLGIHERFIFQQITNIHNKYYLISIHIK